MPRPAPHLDAPTDRPLILLANDDGIEARGLRALAAALAGLGTLAVVAPTEERSAVGHAITVHNPVRAHAWPFEDALSRHVWAYAVTGTPADCVKIAAQRLLPRRPDLVMSGINHGPNTAVNVLYSGTVSAATEAAILGIPSAAVSLCDWNPEADFGPAGRVARRVAEEVLARGLPPGVLLNVNVPAGTAERPAFAVTRQARSRWDEEFHERFDPMRRPYYWLGGTFVNLDEGEDSDLAAIAAGRVSVTPLQLDLTAYAHMEALAGWTWDGADEAAAPLREGTPLAP